MLGPRVVSTLMQWLDIHIRVTALHNLGTPVVLHGMHATTGHFAYCCDA